MRMLHGSLCLCLLLFGCGGAENGTPPARSGSQKHSSTTEQAGRAKKTTNGAIPDSTPPVSRKIIYEADVRLVVDEFSKVEGRISRLVEKHDGYLADASVDRRQGQRRTGRWVARIPVDHYDAFLDELRTIGVPEERDQSARDVTEEYVDLEARIGNKKKLEERIIELLSNRAGKIKDVLEVERELARVRSEIERMEGRLRYLKNRVELTTVRISVREEQDYVPPQAATFTERVANVWWGSLRTLRDFGELLILGCTAAAPWLVVVIPLLWLVRWTWKHRYMRRRTVST